MPPVPAWDDALGKAQPSVSNKPASATLRRRVPTLLILASACLVFCAPLLVRSVAVSPASDFDSHLVPYAAILRDPGAWQWNPYFGLGQPTLADPLTNLFNPVATLTLLVLGPARGLGPLLCLALLMTATTARALCRDLGCRDFAAAFGALAFSCSGFVAGHLFAGHLEFILSLPALPLAWLAARRLADQPRLGIVLAGFAVAWPTLSGAAYFTEYAAAILAVLLLVRCIACRGLAQRIRIVASGGLALALAALLAAIHLLPMLSLIGQLTRMPVSPAGSLPLPSAVWSMLIPPWLVADKAVDAWLEGQPAPTVGWYELSAFIGPLILIPLWGLPLAWRSGKRLALCEGSALAILGLILLNARSPLLPAFWLLHGLPSILALRVPARSLGLVVLAATMVCAIGLDSLLATRSTLHARFWRLVGFAGIATLLPVSGFVLAGQALVALRTPAQVMPITPPGAVPRLLISGGVSQLGLVDQGATILNDYYGWYLSSALNSSGLEALATDEVTRQPMTMTYDSLRPLPAPVWADPPPAKASRAEEITTVANPSPLAPAFLTAGHCSALPCPVAGSAQIIQWGRTTVVAATGHGDQTLVVTQAAVPGWRVAVDSGPARLIPPSDGILTVSALPGAHRYRLTYQTPELRIGASASVVGIAICLWLLWPRRRFTSHLASAAPCRRST